MNIVVCVKQVPNTTEVKLDPVTGALNRAGIPSIINPDDKSGLEAALRLKDELGATVTVLSMGPPQAESALQEALAMGADKAILVTDRAFGGSDSLATSNILASALKKIPYDLIIAGRQAIDGDTAQVGPQIAEHLGLPSATYVEEMRYEDGAMIVRRAFENGYQMLKIKTPCLLTVLKELNTPRLMRVDKIYTAFDEGRIEVWTKESFSIENDIVGLKGSPTKVKKSFTKSPKAMGTVYELPADEAAQLIVDKLKEKYII